jgi:hypothetical protein
MNHGYAGLNYVVTIENIRDNCGLRVERDLHFVADKPLSVHAEVAYTRGLIIT